MRIDQASASARSALRMAFLAASRAASARILAPMTLPLKAFWRDFVLIAPITTPRAGKRNAPSDRVRDGSAPPALRHGDFVHDRRGGADGQIMSATTGSRRKTSVNAQLSDSVPANTIANFAKAG